LGRDAERNLPPQVLRSSRTHRANQTFCLRYSLAMGATFQPIDPAYAQRVRDSFAQQGLLADTFGAELRSVQPGLVEIEVPFSSGLTQQDGFFHAGVGIAILDSACGYSALTLMEDGTRVLTVELKVNLLAPATGERMYARGRVIRPGRNLTVCQGDAYTETGGESKHVATILATMTGIRPR
jgi:uncharacterized protein (TIGR00369 family)